MDMDYTLVDGKLLRPDELKKRQADALRSEIGVYRINLKQAEMALKNGSLFQEPTMYRIARHISRLRETIREREEELNHLCRELRDPRIMH